MPLSYIVQYSTDNSTWTTLSNVQNININIGRQAMLDQYSASTASLTIRYPTGYASPIADMVSGTYIRIQRGYDSRYDEKRSFTSYYIV